MARNMTGHSQFRQAGGGGGAVGAGLPPDGGGVACLLMAAPCEAQYARYSWRPEQRTAYRAIGRHTGGKRSGSVQDSVFRSQGMSTAAPSKAPAFRSRSAWSAACRGYGWVVTASLCSAAKARNSLASALVLDVTLRSWRSWNRCRS